MKNELQTFPVSAGLLDPRHVHAIGAAVWIYLWFLNRVTRDEQRGDDDFVGIVLNGRPVSIQQIADDLGIEHRTCRRYLTHLVDARYVARKKTGAGMFVYTVTKSKKWAWRRQSKAPKSQASLFPAAGDVLTVSTTPQDGSGGPTDQKVVSGSQHPQTKKWSQGRDPQATFVPSTDQKVVSGRKRTRARSHETTKVSQGERSPSLIGPRKSELPEEPYQLARGMMDELLFAGGQSDLQVWSDRIKFEARDAGASCSEAYTVILTHAKAAKARGEFTKPTFWMKDYDRQSQNKKTAVATLRPEPESYRIRREQQQQRAAVGQ